MNFSLYQSFRFLVPLFIGFVTYGVVASPVRANESAQKSTWEHEIIAKDETRQTATILVEVSQTGNPGRTLPVRVVVTASDGSHPDGSGNGVYSDGRFFADGKFRITTPAGPTKLSIGSGPNFVPLDISIDAREGHEHKVLARLYQWFSPEELGWYGGDNHVHVKHDEVHKTRTSRTYTELQGRANGLSYITEAGSGLLVENDVTKPREDFLMRYAPELRPGPFVGHRNTPGLRKLLTEGYYRELIHRPLPTLALLAPVHREGGIIIYTHPMTPPHLLHWMGASETWSHAVLARTADAFDIDSRATESLWFAMLNLGNRVAASASTDAALERVQTPSPGDRRVYSKADGFTYEAIVDGIRKGRTFATNGGPVFAFLSAGTHLSGDTIERGAATLGEIKLEVHTLHPLVKAELYWRGERIRVFPGERRSGKSTFLADLREVASRDGWFVLRAEDEKGNWAITSPIYVRIPEKEERAFAFSTLLEIGNHTRFIELRRDFFAHCIVTASEEISEVELLRDGQVIRTFRADGGNHIENEKIPVTGMGGEYASGWIWHEEGGVPKHFQADYPVTDSGNYLIRARTKSGRVVSSDSVRFSKDAEISHAISAAKIESGDTKLVLHGYGEEMPLSEIRLPFEGDHWWYPRNTYWQMEVQFGARRETIGSNAKAKQASYFQRISSGEIVR